MSLSWISNRSLKMSPRARLVDDGEAEALLRKLEQIEWRPENGFLKDQVIEKTPLRRFADLARRLNRVALRSAVAAASPSGARRAAACRAGASRPSQGWRKVMRGPA